MVIPFIKIATKRSKKQAVSVTRAIDQRFLKLLRDNGASLVCLGWFATGQLIWVNAPGENLYKSTSLRSDSKTNFKVSINLQNCFRERFKLHRSFLTLTRNLLPFLCCACEKVRRLVNANAR